MKQFLFFLFCPIILLAQPSPSYDLKSTITGKVLDKELEQPIPYATIILNDSAGELVTGGITNEEGIFELQNIEPGEYNLLIQFMGYISNSQKIVVAKNEPNIQVGNIFLEADVAQLEDVIVTAEISTIEQKIDRKVINVGKDLTTTGATALEIMNNIPSLNVDQDGNLSLRGNQNVRVLVDGKPSNLDVTQLLKQIPSSSIKAIELITNPSAKYNPEGMSGIINIVLHKNTNLGFNGTVSGGITQGENTRGNASLNLNYRKNKMNFYTNLGTNMGKRFDEGYIKTLDPLSIQKFGFINDNESYLFKVGVDYYLNEKNTISVYTNQNIFDTKVNGDMNVLFPDNSQPDILQSFISGEDGFSSNYNFHFNHDFEKDGHNIELEADYGISDQKEDTDIEYTTENPNYTPYNDIVDLKRTLALFNLDYVNPLSETMKLELGAEARFRRTDNNYETTNLEIDESEYSYDRNIYSLYATFGQNFEKWSYQFGTRFENYNVEAIQNSVKIYEDDYFTLYPSAYVTYTPTEKNQFQLSYSRRVDRPGLSQVNPIRQFATPRFTSVGNPELNPQFTNSMELNYTRNFEKGAITSGVFYRVTENNIDQVIIEDPENPDGLILTFANGESTASSGLELSANYKLFKFWDVNANFSYYSNNLSGVIGDEEIEERSNFSMFRLNNSFKATKQLTFQLFGFYRGPLETLQFDLEEMYFVNAGARYSFMENKASLSLNFSDVFNTQETKLSTTRPQHQIGRFKNESQTIYLGFSYRFGGGKNQALKRKQRDDNTQEGGGFF